MRDQHDSIINRSTTRPVPVAKDQSCHPPETSSRSARAFLELRIEYRRGYRVYFLHVGDRLILLLTGGDKLTQDADIWMVKHTEADLSALFAELAMLCDPGLDRRAAITESFFVTLKTEFYDRRVWPTRAGAKLAVGAWIEDRYNRRRRHSSIGQISPVAFEMRHCNHTAADQQAA